MDYIAAYSGSIRILQRASGNCKGVSPELWQTVIHTTKCSSIQGNKLAATIRAREIQTESIVLKGLVHHYMCVI